ncbi:MAG: response regulator transcription factor [Methylophilaceae bacterium]
MNIVFLEDDRHFASQIVASLELAGHEVDYYDTGRACLKALNESQYDMAILDWEVPDMSGREVLESIKIKGTYPPVVFLTGRDAEEDVIAVIESGADDYIVKPPSPKVLIARINALYRRSNSKATELTVMNYDGMMVDFAKRKFEIDGDAIKLTEKETDLALYFFSQVGVLLSRAHLTKVVWGTTPDIDTRTLDVHVSHLRSKLKLLPEFGWRLISVYHQGYRLERLD